MVNERPKRSGREKDIPVTPVRQTGNLKSTMHPTPKSNSSSESKTNNSNQTEDRGLRSVTVKSRGTRDIHIQTENEEQRKVMDSGQMR